MAFQPWVPTAGSAPTPLPVAQGGTGSATVYPFLLNDEPTGTVARTVARASLSSNGIIFPATGQPMCRIIALSAGQVFSSIGWSSGSTAEVGGTHFWVALMDLNSNVLAVSADQTGGTYVTAAAFLKNAVTNAPFTVPTTGFYYCVVCCSAATTMPTSAGGPLVVGGQNAAAPVMSGTLAVQATPPAVNANLGAITPSALNVGFWLTQP